MATRSLLGISIRFAPLTLPPLAPIYRNSPRLYSIDAIASRNTTAIGTERASA